MRITIIIAALVAVSYAAPLDKPADAGSPTAIAPGSASTLATHIESSANKALSSPTPTTEPSTIDSKHPAQALQANKPLPPVDHPVNVVQESEPHRLENHSPVQDKPEPNLPLSEPHHVQEHELGLHPNKPEKVPESELELTDDEIDALKTIGTLALLQELEEENNREPHGYEHKNKHSNHRDNKYPISPNKDADNDDCNCDAAIIILPGKL